MLLALHLTSSLVQQMFSCSVSTNRWQRGAQFLCRSRTGPPQGLSLLERGGASWLNSNCVPNLTLRHTKQAGRTHVITHLSLGNPFQCSRLLCTFLTSFPNAPIPLSVRMPPQRCKDFSEELEPQVNHYMGTERLLGRHTGINTFVIFPN